MRVYARAHAHEGGKEGGGREGGTQVVPRQSALDWQFVELLHPEFTRRQQFFWGGLKNHKRPKKQGIVRTASDEPGHEGVRVLGNFAHVHAA